MIHVQDPKSIQMVIYNEHFVTITLCYNFKVSEYSIDDLDKIYLIGTNILSYKGDELPVFKINRWNGILI